MTDNRGPWIAPRNGGYSAAAPPEGYVKPRPPRGRAAASAAPGARFAAPAPVAWAVVGGTYSSLPDEDERVPAFFTEREAERHASVVGGRVSPLYGEPPNPSLSINNATHPLPEETR